MEVDSSCWPLCTNLCTSLDTGHLWVLVIMLGSMRLKASFLLEGFFLGGSSMSQTPCSP